MIIVADQKLAGVVPENGGIYTNCDSSYCNRCTALSMFSKIPYP